VADAFFVAKGDRYEPTELTRGPWDPKAQHAGPPAALLGREIERLPADAAMQVGRITFEILRPVPIAPLTVAARVKRPGRSVEFVEATLSDEDGEIVRAGAWRLRTGEFEVPDLPLPDGPGLPGKLDPRYVPPPPSEAKPGVFMPTGFETGYHTAMEYRFVYGDFIEQGPAVAWMRMQVPLVAGEEPSPLTRVLAAADSGNGVSATLDWSKWLFVNVDLTVHLHRMPRGEWVCLDAITVPEANGVGLADSALYDEHGPIGRADQTLLVRPRQA
jgi:hypothetical protein